MIAKLVRIGVVSDQDGFRRQDVLAMTPSERLMCLIRLRDRQFRAQASPIRSACAVGYRELTDLRKR